MPYKIVTVSPFLWGKDVGFGSATVFFMWLPALLYSSKAKLKHNTKNPSLNNWGRDCRVLCSGPGLMWRVLKRCMETSPEGDGRASQSQGSVHLKITCASTKAKWPEKCSADHYSAQSRLRDGHQADKILNQYSWLWINYNPMCFKCKSSGKADILRVTVNWNNWKQKIQS